MTSELKWYDQDHLDWAISNINKKKGTPYYMANEELADKIFRGIKEEFPDAVMVKVNTESYSEQFIVVTKRAQNTLTKRLKARKDNYLRCIQEVDSALRAIESTRP